jgi:hypothetical protein
VEGAQRGRCSTARRSRMVRRGQSMARMLGG